jgi:signal peptidase II
MKHITKLAIVLITVLGCVGCDQTTKVGAQSFLQGRSPIVFLGGFFNFTYAENTGAMLNFGSCLSQNLRFALLVIFVGIVLLATTAFVLLKPLNKITVFAISLILGGGVGNLIDRLIHNGSVVDFMLIKVGGVQTGIFNVADVAITTGTIILCILFVQSESKPDT